MGYHTMIKGEKESEEVETRERASVANEKRENRSERVQTGRESFSLLLEKSETKI